MPEPGWYEDPEDSGRVRWWDGAAWTARTAVAPGAGYAEVGHRRSRLPLVLAVGVIAAVAGLGAFLGVRAVLDDDVTTTDAAGDGAVDTAEPGPSTVPGAELLVGPTEPAIVAVLGSLAHADTDAAAAAGHARALAALDARVLDSNRFTTEGRPELLTADLWVLWSGPFIDEAGAQAFCDGEVAGVGVAECYPLLVVPVP